MSTNADEVLPNQNGPRLYTSLDETDFRKYPEARRDLSAEMPDLIEITYPDGHGNALKLLHFLQTEGILHIGKANYETFVVIYKNAALPPLSEREIDVIEQILRRLVADNSARWANIPRRIKLRLIGDLLADRGNNDALTLGLLWVLHKVLPLDAFTILLSNHDVGALISSEENYQGQYPNIDPLQCRSQSNMVRQWQDPTTNNTRPVTSATQALPNLWTREGIKDVIRECYLPHLKPLDYSLMDRRFALYSHAPVGLETVRAFAKFFHIAIPAQFRTVEEVCEAIKKINSAFQAWISAPGGLHAFCEAYCVEHAQQERLHELPIPPTLPLYRVTWNRLRAYIEFPDALPFSSVSPLSYPMIAIYGHLGGGGYRLWVQS